MWQSFWWLIPYGGTLNKCQSSLRQSPQGDRRGLPSSFTNLKLPEYPCISEVHLNPWFTGMSTHWAGSSILLVGMVYLWSFETPWILGALYLLSYLPWHTLHFTCSQKRVCSTKSHACAHVILSVPWYIETCVKFYRNSLQRNVQFYKGFLFVIWYIIMKMI